MTYPNGAVAPYDPNVAIATAQHYAAKAAHGRSEHFIITSNTLISMTLSIISIISMTLPISWAPLEGAAAVHPPAPVLAQPLVGETVLVSHQTKPRS